MKKKKKQNQKKKSHKRVVHSKGKKRKKRKKKNSRVTLVIKELVISLIVGTLIGAMIFFYVYSFQRMTGNGMAPVIEKNDMLLVNKRFKELNRFDVVFLEGSNKDGAVRVIGLPGESVRYKEDYLYVNEQPVDEKFLIKTINTYNKDGKTFTEGESSDQLLQVDKIPKGYYFVLGDNRPHATDSRYYGLVSKDDIKGKVPMTLLPIKRIDHY